MTSNHHEDLIFKAKRRPKGPIKFKLQLNDEQKEAKALILENPVTVLKGMDDSDTKAEFYNFLANNTAELWKIIDTIINS